LKTIFVTGSFNQLHNSHYLPIQVIQEKMKKLKTLAKL